MTERERALVTGAALYAAVYANPEDDAPRIVLADYLQERGDPRGELIALQLARAAGGKRTRRESELLAIHTTEWLRGLRAMLKANVTFERGFLASCAVRATAPGEALARPEMATVVDLDVRSWASSRTWSRACRRSVACADSCSSTCPRCRSSSTWGSCAVRGRTRSACGPAPRSGRRCDT